MNWRGLQTEVWHKGIYVPSPTDLRMMNMSAMLNLPFLFALQYFIAKRKDKFNLASCKLFIILFSKPHTSTRYNTSYTIILVEIWYESTMWWKCVHGRMMFTPMHNVTDARLVKRFLSSYGVGCTSWHMQTAGIQLVSSHFLLKYADFQQLRCNIL